jgi:hypothetical protein
MNKTINEDTDWTAMDANEFFSQWLPQLLRYERVKEANMYPRYIKDEKLSVS